MMTTRTKIRLALFAVLALFLGIALSDVLGLRSAETSVRGPQGYVAINHGSHSHYVPNGWSGDPPLGEFPTQPPPAGMTVGPAGDFVPLNP
jgi:hypothetical protein